MVEETVEVPSADVVETAPEVTSDIPSEATPEVAKDVEVTEEVPAEEAPAEEVVEDAPVETVEAKPEELVVFDVAAPDLLEKVTETLDAYEVPQPLQAAIDALKAKAEAQTTDAFAEYAEYGDPDKPEDLPGLIRSLLDRQALLDGVTEVSPGQFRPNTDKFVEQITDPVKASWLHHDLNKTASDKYQGLNRFQETIVDAFAKEGDTVGSVLDRFHALVEHMSSGTMPISNVPSFIPESCKEAYWLLSTESREEYEYLDPSNDILEYDERGVAINRNAMRREDRLRELATMQKGLDTDKSEAQRTQEANAKRDAEFATNVQVTQDQFYSSFRETFAKNLVKEVTFSPDPKMQILLAGQQVTLLEQALDPGSAGEFARKSLTDAGINFDYAKAQQLMKAVDIAAVAVNTHKRVGADGQLLNKIELNKATAAFERAGRDLQKFAADIIDQEAKLVSTGTSEAVKKEAEKIKVAVKARPAANGTPSANTKRPANPHPYGSIKYYEYQADEIMRAKKSNQVGAY